MSNSIRHITTKRPFTESARSKLLPSAGVHVTVDAFVSDPDKVFKETHLQTLFTSLVSALDMKILHGPEFIEVPVDPEILRKSQESKEFLDEGGITGMCVISKSHIAIHCWPLQRFFSMDVFSCGDYDPEVALKIIRTHMGVQNESTHIINRRKPITQAPSVYCITNKINNKKYVGKSKDPEARLGQHIWTSGHPDHNGYMPIHAAIAKYGLVNFSFSILQEYASDAEAFEGERKWVLELRTNNREFGYNLNGGGRRTSFSAETKAKIATANRGKKRTSEFKQRMSVMRTGAGNPMFGRQQKPEVRTAKSRAWLGDGNPNKLKFSAETVYKIRALVKERRTHASIGEEFGVSGSVITNIVNGKGSYAKFPSDRTPVPKAKLSAGIANEIRKSHLSGTSMKALASKYGVHYESIRSILLGKTWTAKAGKPGRSSRRGGGR